MEQLSIENILIQLRELLQLNAIKLWEEPYYSEGSPIEKEIENLAAMSSTQLNISISSCKIAILELQSHSLDKLKNIENFKNTGVATLKVRVPAQAGGEGGTNMITVEVKLADPAIKLQEIIASKLNVSFEKIKLISSGKVLNADQTLEEQNIKNSQQILALMMNISDVDVQNDRIYDKLQKIRSEAELLLKNDDSFFHLEDQSGNTIHVPESERKALTMALLLHEKGKSQLKLENYNEALILFLEADQELKLCNSQLVESVDNYAILNLDIVWTYLCLKSIMQLQDAERRLKICEQSFKRTYGENYSRLADLKGSTENEKALIVRLHLMQAILFFHQNRRPEAISLLSMVENEMSALRVNNESVKALVEMGFKTSEAITGLRATQNNISDAVNFISDRRKKLQEAREVGKKERDLKTSIENLGFDPEEVNIRSLHNLVQMGFQKDLCALALQKSRNDVPQAITLLQNHKSELTVEVAKLVKPKKNLIEKLINFGFDESLSASILKMNGNDLDAAIDSLLNMQNGGIPEQLLSLIDNDVPSTSGSSTESGTAVERLRKKIKLSAEELKAFESIKTDINDMEDDDHLNISLEQEESLLKQYKKVLSE